MSKPSWTGSPPADRSDPLPLAQYCANLIGSQAALGQSLDRTRSGARADRARASVLKARDQELLGPAFGCMMHERSPHRSECLGKVWCDIGPSVDEECAVKVLEELYLVAVLEQPDVRLDTGLTVQKVVRAPRAAGVPDSQWGEAISRVEAPELIGHLAGPAAGLDLAERHARLQPELVTECVEDALDDGKGRRRRASLVRRQRGLRSAGAACDGLLRQTPGGAGYFEK